MRLKINPQREFREREKVRIEATPRLSERFETLKAIEIELDYFEGDSTRRLGVLTYTLNLGHARAAFTFTCPNHLCLDGDFDLSQRLAEAVQNHRANAEGEMRCPGRRCKRGALDFPCNNTLRYRLKLLYHARSR